MNQSWKVGCPQTDESLISIIKQDFLKYPPAEKNPDLLKVILILF